jgi:dipeptidyl aminopeptidase/acylaminoacyl peptidase
VLRLGATLVQTWSKWIACLGLIAGLTLTPWASVHAESPKAVASASTEARPAKIATVKFVDPGYIRDVKISPDGTRIAFRENINNKSYVGFKTVDGVEVSRVAVPQNNTLRWFRWAGNNRLLISLSAVTNLGDFEIALSALVSYDITTKASLQIGRKSQGFNGDDVLFVDPDGQYLLLALQKSIFDLPSVLKIDLATNQSIDVVRPQSDIWTWIADDNGVVRMGLAYTSNTVKIYYRRSDADKFKLISKIKESSDEKSKEESLFHVAAIVSDSDDGYILSNKQTGRFALYKFNYLTREIGEKVFDNPENDVEDFELTTDGRALFSARFTDERNKIVYFEAEDIKRQKALERALPGQEVWIQSKSRDGNRMVLFTTSPTDPGGYSIYDVKARTLNRMADVNPALDPAQLSTTRYVRYPARDGLSIPAYLTLPRGRKAAGFPLIILPHGGPFGVRDTLDYNMEVQFLSNRGYVVLQPNFRGSDSYGETFYKRGEGQIGRAMQDDLDDGMDYLVKSGLVDSKRVCIVGSSYGGYAALWGVIRNPERYRCAVSFAGVTDFKSQLKFDGRTLRSRYARQWKDKVQGDASFDLDRVSPAKMVGNLTRPVLLAHGDVDSNVPYSQFKQMMAAAKKAGKSIENFTYKGEGHGFDNKDNQKDWLDRMDSFLTKHNPAD